MANTLPPPPQGKAVDDKGNFTNSYDQWYALLRNNINSGTATFAPIDAPYVLTHADSRFPGTVQILDLLASGFLMVQSNGVIASSPAVDLGSQIIGNLSVRNLNNGTLASSSTFWRGDGTWAAGVGTITSITAGTGLTGGTITSSGTIALDIPVSISHGGTGLSSIPNSSVYDASGTTLAASAFTKIKFDTKNAGFDSANYYDTTNKRYLPLIAGTYLVTASTYTGSGLANTLFQCAVFKNGSQYKTSKVEAPANADYYSFTISCLVQLNGSTDYIEIFCYNGHASSTVTTGAGSAGCHFDIIWVSP